MNSSISDSDPAAVAAARRWRRFAAWILVTALVASACLVGLALALDPYDTGFGLVHVAGIVVKGPRIANASRVHDATFDSAIFGNSHVMSLSPARLSQLTGRRFVMLGVPGTGVPEQMILLDSYLARHPPPRTLLFGIDRYYCLPDPRALPETPFPDWLYTADRLAYAAALFRASTLPALGRRIGLMAGWLRPASRDGTFDLYEGEVPDPAVSAARIAAGSPDDLSGPMGADRPGLRQLGDRLRALPPATEVVLLLPPVAAQTLPRPGTAAADALAACKAAVSALAGLHPHTVVLDWQRPRPETAITANFRDPSHYYHPLARAVEADVAGALEAPR